MVTVRASEGSEFSSDRALGLVKISLLSIDNMDDVRLVRFQCTDADEYLSSDTIIKVKLYKHDYSIISIGPCELWYEGQVNGHHALTVEVETGYDYIYDIRIFARGDNNRYTRIEKKIGILYNMDLLMNENDQDSDIEDSPEPVNIGGEENDIEEAMPDTPEPSSIEVPGTPVVSPPTPTSASAPAPVSAIGPQPSIIENDGTREATNWIDFCVYSCNQFLSHLRIHRNSHINKLSQTILRARENARYIEDIKYSTTKKTMFTVSRPTAVPGTNWSSLINGGGNFLPPPPVPYRGNQE